MCFFRLFHELTNDIPESRVTACSSTLDPSVIRISVRFAIARFTCSRLPGILVDRLKGVQRP